MNPPSPRTDPPPGTPEWERSITRLHAALAASGYKRIEHVPTVRNPFGLVLEPLNLWGLVSGRGRRLMEPSAMPGFYHKMLSLSDARLGRLMSFFHQNRVTPEAQARALIAELLDAAAFDELMAQGVLRRADGDGVRSRQWYVPTGELLLVSDPFDRTIPDFAYIGRDSLWFADRLRRVLRGRRFGRALDLCSGTGVQGLTVARFADQVLGVEINPRSAAYGNLNARLNGLGDRVSFRVNDLAEGIDPPFDLVVANPPYVWMPEEEGRQNRDGYGGELGLQIVQRIIASLDRLLSPIGEAHIVSDSPVMSGKSALDSMIERELAGRGLGATLYTVRYLYDRKRAAFLRSKGVSHQLYYHVVIGRSQPPGLRVVPLSPPRQLANSAYLTLARAVYG